MMENLDQDLQAEGQSPSTELIREFSERIRVTADREERISLIKRFAEESGVPTEALTSHFFESIPVGVKPSEGGEDFDGDSLGVATVEELSSSDSRLDHSTVRKIQKTPLTNVFRAPRGNDSKETGILKKDEGSGKEEKIYWPQVRKKNVTGERVLPRLCFQCGENLISRPGQEMCDSCFKIKEREKTTVASAETPKGPNGVKQREDDFIKVAGPSVSGQDTTQENEYLMDCLRAAGWRKEDCLPDEVVEFYTAHILRPAATPWESCIDRIAAAFVSEMEKQHSLVMEARNKDMRREYFREAELREWLGTIANMEGLGESVRGPIKQFCADAASHSGRGLLRVLGGGAAVNPNALQMVKLVALQRQRKMATDFLGAVDMAIDAVASDGFQGDWYAQLVKAHLQPPVEAGFLLDSGEVMADDSEESDAVTVDSFLSAGGESALPQVRAMVAGGHMRQYRAPGNMGYASCEDAPSREVPLGSPLHCAPGDPCLLPGRPTGRREVCGEDSTASTSDSRGERDRERSEMTHALEVRQRRAELICARGDAHPSTLTLLTHLVPWKLDSSGTARKTASTGRGSVRVEARSVISAQGRYDIVQFLNALSAKAVKMGWSLRTQVLELKDGEIIANPDIQQFVEDQLARGQGSWRRGDYQYGYDSPVTWENPQDQLEDEDNHSYWVMRMTDLGYILLQRWHDHLTNDQLEQAMAELPPPDRNDGSSIARLFDSELALWHRVSDDRRAKSLLEGKMLHVVGRNESFGPSLIAEYRLQRKALKDRLHGGGADRLAAADWVPDVESQATLWDKIANRMLRGEITYVMPDQQILPALDRTKARKVSTAQASAVSNTSGSNSEGESSQLQQILEALRSLAPKGGGGRYPQLTERPYKDCSHCSGRHFGLYAAVGEHCRRLVEGKWQAAEFLQTTPRSIRLGTNPAYKDAETYWRHSLEKHYPLFAKEATATKDKFFNELRRLEKSGEYSLRKVHSSRASLSVPSVCGEDDELDDYLPEEGQDGASSPLQDVNHKPPQGSRSSSKKSKNRKMNSAGRRIVMFAKERQAEGPDQDTLAMFRVDYVLSDGTTKPGWVQFDPGSMESLIRRDVALAMGCRLRRRPKWNQLVLRGVGAEDILVEEDAIVHFRIPGAILVQSRESDPKCDDELQLSDEIKDLEFEWCIPCIPKCSMPFILGGEQLEHYRVQQHHAQGMLSWRKQKALYAIGYMSWLSAMMAMKSCGDEDVLRSHSSELAELKEVKPLVGHSKAYTLRGHGQVPIEVGKTTRHRLKGWVRIEAEPFADEALPIVFEPTICKAENLHVDAFTPLSGSVSLPKFAVSVTVTPIIQAPQVVIDNHEELANHMNPK